MDDVRVGLVIRAVRLRRGLRQSDVARTAGVAQTMVSLIERGGLEETSLRIVRRVAMAVGVSLPFDPRWRGADLARLMDARHARIVDLVVARLRDLGWEVRPERTFSVFGERGSIDVFAWLPASRALLIVEVKSEVADLQDLVSTLDRKRRLGPKLAAELGWRPLVVGTVVVLPSEHRARSAVNRHSAIFDAAYPARTVEVRRWIRRPDRDLRGIWFLPVSARGAARSSRAHRTRPTGPMTAS
jgi:transcriptional regulator with XRE-family HTH domain